MEFCGRPSPSDVEAIDSPFAATMMESCSVSQARRLQDVFPHASPDAADLLRCVDAAGLQSRALGAGAAVERGVARPPGSVLESRQAGRLQRDWRPRRGFRLRVALGPFSLDARPLLPFLPAASCWCSTRTSG